MSELTVKDLEVTREIPGNPPEKGGPAKIVKVSFEEDEREPEIFATARTHLPSKGDKVPVTDLEFNQQWSSWRFKRKQSQDGRGSGQVSPERELRIVRQHSQEQAIRVMAILGRVLSEEEFLNLINWFVADAYRKDKGAVAAWPTTSDVPGDTTGLPPISQSDSEAFE